MRFFLLLLLSSGAYSQQASVDDLPALTALMKDSAAIARYVSQKGFVPARSTSELVVFIEKDPSDGPQLPNFVTLDRRAGIVMGVSLVTGDKAVFQRWMNALQERGFTYRTADVVSGTRADGFEREGMAVIAMQHPEGYYQLLARQGVSVKDFFKQYFEL